ncbi:hypothetical protein CHS0354_001964 [Potamilus streckersoni]|uniref:Uncharacterized protein n=1 Tax=Potamilus streckersoni TaxID=2493646 RepID=A0AAE0W8C0_9BIVA|nr:hypothetical protein CHS0354_001964 [Potamilus streckersoni]
MTLSEDLGGRCPEDATAIRIFAEKINAAPIQSYTFITSVLKKKCETTAARIIRIDEMILPSSELIFLKPAVRKYCAVSPKNALQNRVCHIKQIGFRYGEVLNGIKKSNDGNPIGYTASDKQSGLFKTEVPAIKREQQSHPNHPHQKTDESKMPVRQLRTRVNTEFDKQ